jgi:hypothetical protein
MWSARYKLVSPPPWPGNAARAHAGDLRNDAFPDYGRAHRRVELS